MNFDAAQEAGIPHENIVDGFANRAGGLVIELSLMEKYFTAADLALEKLFMDPGSASARKALLIAAPKDSVAPADAVRQVLRPFLRRAFRRPVSDQEVERCAKLADTPLAAAESFEDKIFAAAILKSLKPALVSPHFLLRIEATPEQRVSRISEHELAVRMSYFLWATMPDDILLDLADRGELSCPDELEKQVRRMLSHEQAKALTRHFLTSWLQLPQLKKALPSQNQFPAFTRSLRDAMERETQLFCEHLRTEDRSILELLDAEYTFANAELARHYQLAEIPAMIFDGKQFVGIGQGTTYTAPDGKEWHRIANENSPTVVAFGDGIYVGSLWPGKLLRSTDGIHWKPVLELTQHILGLGYGNLGVE